MLLQTWMCAEMSTPVKRGKSYWFLMWTIQIENHRVMERFWNFVCGSKCKNIVTTHWNWNQTESSKARHRLRRTVVECTVSGLFSCLSCFISMIIKQIINLLTPGQNKMGGKNTIQSNWLFKIVLDFEKLLILTWPSKIFLLWPPLWGERQLLHTQKNSKKIKARINI